MVTIVALCILQPAGATAPLPKEIYLATLEADAEKGNRDAQYELGNNYFVGAGIRKDYSLAAKWFQRAAEQGHAQAQSTLGLLYSMGTGVPRDHKEALKWWVKAAEQHDADAQNLIGFAYLIGDGVPKNHTQAYMWFDIAATNGAKHAISDRESVSKFMIEEQIADAKKQSQEWLDKFPKQQASNQAASKTAQP